MLFEKFSAAVSALRYYRKKIVLDVRSFVVQAVAKAEEGLLLVRLCC